MASFVLLLKECENENVVIYRFGPNEQQMGLIELNKVTDIFSELEPVPNAARPSSKFYFDRAAQRIVRCLIEEGGVFPDKLTFAS